MVALDDPLRRPYAEKDDLRKYSQHEVDLINTKANILDTIPFERLVKDKKIDISRVAIKDHESMEGMRNTDLESKDRWILTLDGLFSDDILSDHFKKILNALEEDYHYPVEIEFTINYAKNDTFRINLLQCRPLQTKGLGHKVDIPDRIINDNILFGSEGYFLGGNISQKINRVISVDPEKYSKLVLSDKYQIARLAGKLNRTIKDKNESPALLMGPGRWGTTTPSLGVPVKFAEINNIAVLVEVAFSGSNFMPELSFGTHFFQDLVETNIFYVALFPEKKGIVFNTKWLKGSTNIFSKLMPDSSRYEDIISVYDVTDRDLRIMSDVVSQNVVCFST